MYYLSNEDDSQATKQNNMSATDNSTPLQTPTLPSECPVLSPTQSPEHGYGSAMSSMELNKSIEAATGPSTQSEAKWFRTRCCSRMVDAFVCSCDEFLLRGKTPKRFVIDAHETDWFWRHAADVLNKSDLVDINYSLLVQDESHPEALRRLDYFISLGMW